MDAPCRADFVGANRNKVAFSRSQSARSGCAKEKNCDASGLELFFAAAVSSSAALANTNVQYELDYSRSGERPRADEPPLAGARGYPF